MARFKTANAQVIASGPQVGDHWEVLRRAAFSPAPNFRQKTAKVVLQEYEPKDFLLSHCTIIASVDTEETAGQPLGRSMVDGFQIDRKYADYYITPQTSKFVNNNCFVPGTMILLSDGTEKPIEQVIVGDSVITHTGAVRTVTETFVHPFKGYLRSIQRLGDQRTLDVSPEHPFFAMTPAMTCACGCGTSFNRRGRKAAVHRFQDYVKGHGARPRVNEKSDFTWVSAGLLDKGDFLSMPRLQGEVVAPEVTPGKARLLGYYLAEGYYHKQKAHRVKSSYRATPNEGRGSIPVAVDFALNLDETDTLVAEIQRLLQSEFGVGSSVARVSENGVTVHSHQSLALLNFFKAHATEYATTKRVKAHVLQWPLRLQREVVQGWIEGDGCVESTAGGWVSVTSASSDLISQMHVIFGRLGVFATRHTHIASGRKRVRVANGTSQIVNDPSKTCVSHTLQVGSVHAETLLGGSFLEPLYRRSIRNRRKHTLGFRVAEQRTMFPVRSVTKKFYEGLVFNFETEVDHSYVANGVAVHNSDAWERKLLMACFKTFIGAENYVEHIQIPELSKGKIIDAAARNIGDSLYVDILIATSRRHKPLVEAITSGKIGTLSMGCSVEFTTCTKCGNVAEDETQLCPHIRYFKGSEFVDAAGNKRKIAELCGHVNAEPGSVKFIEASWVANPAFTGAVLRSILNADEVDGLGKKLQVAFSQGPRSISDMALLKAARAQNSTPRSNLGAFLIDGFEDMGNKLGVILSAPTDMPWGNDFNFPVVAQEQDQGPKDPPQDSGESGAETPKKEEPVDPLHKAVSDLADVLREHAVAQVRKEIGKDEAARLTGTPENQNDTLIKSAFKHSSWRSIGASVLRMTKDVEHTKTVVAGLILHKRGGWQAVKTGCFTGREILAISRVVDRLSNKSSMAGEARVYQAVIAVGGIAPYPDVETYLAACRQVLGRPLSGSESGALLEKGRLFSLGS